MGSSGPRPVEENNKVCKNILSLILLPPFFLKNVKSIFIIRIWKIYKCLTKNIIQKLELRHLVTFSTTTLYNTLLPYCFFAASTTITTTTETTTNATYLTF